MSGADLLKQDDCRRPGGGRLGQLHRQRLKRLRESHERIGVRIGVGRLADLLEHDVERLARRRLGQLHRQRLKHLREGHERIRGRQ